MSADMRAKTPPAQQPDDPQATSPGRWRKGVLLVLGLVAIGALAAALMPRAGSLPKNGPKRTHTVIRGDLAQVRQFEG